MNHKPGTRNLFTPKGKGQAVGRWSRISKMVIGLSALVMAILVVFAPGTVAAADIAFVAENPKVMGTHCPDAATAIELDQNYGTFSGCRTDLADHIVSANPDQTALELELSGRFGRDRSYGTFVGVWTDPVDREATANPDQTALELELSGRFGRDRSYGTFVDAWTGLLDREATANPDQTALELELSGRFGQERSYGTFVDAWTGQLDREATANPD